MPDVDLIYDWIGKRVLTHETVVEIRRLCFRPKEEAYAEAYDEKGRYYRLPLKSLRYLERPIEGVVVHGRL